MKNYLFKKQMVEMLIINVLTQVEDIEKKMITIIRDEKEDDGFEDLEINFDTILKGALALCNTVSIINKKSDELYFDELIQHGQVIVNLIDEPNIIPEKYNNEDRIIIDIYNLSRGE